MSNIRGYKIDFSANTITLNYRFANAATTNFYSEEYELLKKIQDDYPSFKVLVKSGRTKKKAQVNKRMTYANMEKYMTMFQNREELLQRFEVVKGMSRMAASPYKYVCDWFEMQFPDYKKIDSITKKIEKTVALTEVPNVLKYKNEQSA